MLSVIVSSSVYSNMLSVIMPSVVRVSVMVPTKISLTWEIFLHKFQCQGVSEKSLIVIS